MPGAGAGAEVVDGGGPGMNRLALRVRDDVLAVIDPHRRAREALAEEAAFRGISVGALAEDVLEAVADADMFAVVLDKSRGRRG